LEGYPIPEEMVSFSKNNDDIKEGKRIFVMNFFPFAGKFLLYVF